MKRFLLTFWCALLFAACAASPTERDATLDSSTDISADLSIGDKTSDSADWLASDSGVPADTLPLADVGSDTVPPAPQPTQYPTDRVHSPITPMIKANLRAIFQDGQLKGQRPHVFAKLGASFEDSPSAFVGCLGTSTMNLDSNTHLQGTVDHFAQEIGPELAGTNAWNRDSEAAISGWAAVDGLTTKVEGKSAIAYELDLIKPAFALIAYNGNDVGKSTIDEYETNLRAVIQLCLERGIIPILRTKPREETTSTTRPRRIIQFNAVIRGLAQRYQLPFLDLNLAVRDVPEALGSDGLHLSSYSNNGTKNCWFTPEALMKGKPVYNLRFLEALDRLRRVVINDENPPDAPSPLTGDGTHAKPFVATLGNFTQTVNAPGSPNQNLLLYTLTHVANTATSTESLFAQYPSCGTQNEAGNEVVYRVEIPNGPGGETLSGKLTVHLFENDGDVDVDPHWLTALDPNSCVARDNETFSLDNVSSGNYYLVLDTFASQSGTTRPGTVLFFAIFEPGI